MHGKFGKALVSTVVNSEIPDIVAEVADGAIDVLSNSEIVKDIPIVGPIYKLAKIGLDIREQLFIRRLCRFLTDSRLSGEEIDKAKQKISEMDSNNLGERVLTAIEKCDDYLTSGKIGRIFKSYLLGEINLIEFQRLSKAVLSIIPEDFKVLSLMPNEIQRVQIFVTKNLHNAGLLELMSVFMDANGSDTNPNKYKTSELGIRYLRIAERIDVPFIEETSDEFSRKYLRNK